MPPSKLSKDQVIKVLKAAAYVGASAVLDYLISQTSGTQFGTLTPIINIGLVFLKQVFTKPQE